MLYTDGNASIKESMTYPEHVPMSEVTLKQSRTNLYEKGVSTPKECLYFTSGGGMVDDQNCVEAAQTMQIRDFRDHHDLYAQSTRVRHDTGHNDGGEQSAFTCTGASSFRVHGSTSEERTYEVPFMATKVRYLDMPSNEVRPAYVYDTPLPSKLRCMKGTELRNLS